MKARGATCRDRSTHASPRYRRQDLPHSGSASRGPFLLIADDATAAACAEQFPGAALLNLRNHSFAIRRDYDGVRDFADIVFPDKDLMTYMHGKGELVKLLLDTTTPITG